MKIIIWLFITTIAVTIIVSCSMQKLSSTEITVLYDITDTQVAQPNVDEILALCNLQNKWNGIEFRFGKLTDVSYNIINIAKLDAKNEWLSNEMERNKEIKNFKDAVSRIVSNMKKDKTGKTNSSIYLPITTELNRLSKSNVNKRVLIIYSDLMENTQNLSFYKKQDIALLKNTPKQVKEQLEKLAVINNLTGIEVRFIYQPTDNRIDQIFHIVSEFYKDLLENKGAKVTISANLNL